MSWCECSKILYFRNDFREVGFNFKICIWNIGTWGMYQSYLEFRRFSRNDLKVIAVICLFWKENFGGIFIKRSFLKVYSVLLLFYGGLLSVVSEFSSSECILR